ncbi:hypothetical protein T10_11367 [Trichinella papuae]|uniref:Uncharacterized protein n=1 Tax=Trichinella papuae TaxID=268474 RepID=A0A0V1M0D7_9BILA|nr:hypothetical protein T10_11367 [Trichinella papuae]
MGYFLAKTFPFLILLDHESGRNNLKHVGQIISAEVSFPSNATADAFFCYPNLDAGLKDCTTATMTAISSVTTNEVKAYRRMKAVH